MVGVPAWEGNSRYDKGPDTYTVVGSGTDIWNTTGDFHFACQKLKGNGSITARIESIENVHELTKAGVTIGGTLEANSPNAMRFVPPSGILLIQHRQVDAGTSCSANTPPNGI